MSTINYVQFNHSGCCKEKQKCWSSEMLLLIIYEIFLTLQLLKLFKLFKDFNSCVKKERKSANAALCAPCCPSLSEDRHLVHEPWSLGSCSHLFADTRWHTNLFMSLMPMKSFFCMSHIEISCSHDFEVKLGRLSHGGWWLEEPCRHAPEILEVSQHPQREMICFTLHTLAGTLAGDT